MCVLLYLFKTRVLLECCIFQPAIGCCALQTLVEIVIFSVFYAKKLKNAKICYKIKQKTGFFSLYQNAGLLFFCIIVM